MRVDYFNFIGEKFVFRNLCSFLTDFEKNKLSQTCKQNRRVCLELKLVTYKLTRKTSLKFYRGFLQQKNTMVSEQERKVYTNICNQQLEGVRIVSIDLRKTNYKLIDLKKFGNYLEKINVSYSKHLVELLNMGDKLKDIDMRICDSFTNFSGFNSVKKLEISRLNNSWDYIGSIVDDSSFFTNMRELSIENSNAYSYINFN